MRLPKRWRIPNEAVVRLLIGDVPSATAILDRFLHNAEVIAITGRSYRLRNHAAGDEAMATAKSKGRRGTADSEGCSPPEDTNAHLALSSAGSEHAQPEGATERLSE